MGQVDWKREEERKTSYQKRFARHTHSLGTKRRFVWEAGRRSQKNNVGLRLPVMRQGEE